MRRIWAIACATWRAAVRTRAALTLGGLLAAVAAGLPLIVRGDGTPAGDAQVRIGFTLGAVGAILGLAALGSGCAAVSLDIEERRIHQLVTKPVRSLHIWLGKWLGLALLQAALLAVAGSVLLGSLHAAGRLPDSVRRSRAVAEPDVDAEVREAMRAWEAAHPGEAGPEARAAVAHRLRIRAFTVAPGATRAWRVRLPVAPAPDAPVELHFRFVKSALDLEPVSGIWFAGPPDAGPRAEHRGAWRPRARHVLEIPGHAAGDGREALLAFAHLEESGATLVFDPDGGIELLVPRGSFEANLFRALLILFFRLAFLAAVGLAAGTLFSFPVAALCAFSVALMLHLAGFVGDMAARQVLPGRDESAAAALLDRAARAVFRTLHAGLRPLSEPDAVRDAATGRRVSWRRIGRSFSIHLAGYGAALAWISAAALRRRELGAPA